LEMARGRTSSSAAAIPVAAEWPDAIHDGGGRGHAYVGCDSDERALSGEENNVR